MPISPPKADPATPVEFLGFLRTYLRLMEAHWVAQDRQVPAREHPVAWTGLRALGIKDGVLFWMLYQDHVEHLQPASVNGNGQASLQKIESLLLCDHSYFSLTEQGEAFADRFLADVFACNGEIFQAAWDTLWLGRLTPRYDGEERIFSWGQHVLKCFRQPSGNQELLLRAAEELGWAPWFDDPLPRRGRRNAKGRLHTTIKALNRFQTPYLIHFKGDGTGRRLGWEYR